MKQSLKSQEGVGEKLQAEMMMSKCTLYTPVTARIASYICNVNESCPCMGD